MRPCILLILAVAATAAAEPAPQALRTRLVPAQALYLAQQLDGPERPVGDAIVLGDTRLALRRDDDGGLAVDLKGDGRFKDVRPGALLNVEAAIGGARQKQKLFLRRDADGAWRYRNAMELLLQIGDEVFVAVDADGDGAFNEPGVDGLTWQGQLYVFPFPKPEETFCGAGIAITGLRMGPWGEDASAVVTPLSTTVPEALPVLRGVNEERVRIGLTPRPEAPELSGDLQKHCRYMALNKQLAHPEESGKPGYSPEGHAAGMRSILSTGWPADRVAALMVTTYLHRLDVLRPDTLAFGVGYEGSYGGIDGRTRMGAPARWPVLCPAPNQPEVPTAFSMEGPNPIAGIDADQKAGFPITVYWNGGDIALGTCTLLHLDGKGGMRELPCHRYDPDTGPEQGMTRGQRVLCLIPQDPLPSAAVIEIRFAATVAGKPWTRTWRFATAGAPKTGWQL